MTFRLTFLAPPAWFAAPLSPNRSCLVTDRTLGSPLTAILRLEDDHDKQTLRQSSVVDQLNRGVEVDILERVDNWYKIKSNTQQFGWVSEDFLAFKSKDITGYEQEQLAIEQKEQKVLAAAEAERLEQEHIAQAKHQVSVTQNNVNVV